MMMNFLDLSAASEEERRLIREILSDTSVINIAEPQQQSNNNPNHHSNNNIQSQTHYHQQHQQPQSVHQQSQHHYEQNQRQQNQLPQQTNQQNPKQKQIIATNQNGLTIGTTINDTPISTSPNSRPIAPPQPQQQVIAQQSNVSNTTSINNHSASTLTNNIYMTSTQPPGYALPTHVTAFPPHPPPHPHPVYGQPLFPPYHYLIPFNITPQCVPFVLPPNSVVQTQTQTQQNTARQPTPPQLNRQPNANANANNSHSHPRYRHNMTQHNNQQMQQSQSTQRQQRQHQLPHQTTHHQAPNSIATTNQHQETHPVNQHQEPQQQDLHPPQQTKTTQQQSQQEQLLQKPQRPQQNQCNNLQEPDTKSQLIVEQEHLNQLQQKKQVERSQQEQPKQFDKTRLEQSQKEQFTPEQSQEQSKVNEQCNDTFNSSDTTTTSNDATSTTATTTPTTTTTTTTSITTADSDIVNEQDESESRPNQFKTNTLNELNNSTTLTNNTETWVSASSKSWASLFKRGAAGTDNQAINGEVEHNNSGSENSDTENNKIKLSSQSVGSIGGYSNSTSKEQRSQEAAKRALDKMAMRFAQKISSINLKHSLPFIKPRGFINKGNGCYINATLQALIACPPFYNLMKEIGDLRGFRRENSCTPVLDSFAELFLNFPPLVDTSKRNKQQQNQSQQPTQDQKLHIDNLQAEAIEPKCIYNVLGSIKSECLKGAQEDAEEFLSSVLNGLHEEMIGLGEIMQSTQDSANQNGNPIDVDDLNDDLGNDDNLWREVGSKNRSLPIRTAKVINTPIQEIFGGSLFSIRIAGKDRCGHRSPFFDLQLDISGDNVKSVQDAIKSFTAPEIIHDFYCSKTKQKLDAQRRTSLDQLPPILILHLKQFVYTQDHGLKKLIKKIEYPIDFELPDNCLHEKSSTEKNMRTSRSYKLLAVVYHNGKEAIKGHYLTDVYHIGSSQWIRCDDSNLKVISSPRVDNPDSTRTPYLLFYRRLNTLRAQTAWNFRLHDSARV